MEILVGVTLFLLVSMVTSTDYCRKDLCKKGKHIACRNPGKWGSACGKNPELYRLTNSDKEFILDLHNRDRQAIASGSLFRYDPAACMKEMTWNDELAHVASFNAKSCIFAHDECRNTDNHPSSGQNLAIVGQSKGYKDIREAYEDLHNKWFLEHKHCDMRNINKYENKPIRSGEKIGHFTLMVGDKVNEVGCAISKFEKNGMKFVYIVCNYSYTNMLKQPVYVVGAPSCDVFSERYDALCVA